MNSPDSKAIKIPKPDSIDQVLLQKRMLEDAEAHLGLGSNTFVVGYLGRQLLCEAQERQQARSETFATLLLLRKTH